jgi:hypothetical protein
MAGVKGKSGPPGNANGFKHGLSMLAQRRAEKRLPRGKEKRAKLEILDGLLSDKGKESVSTALKLQAELIASDAVWLNIVERAIQRVIRLNPKARDNPKALSVLDDYRRPVINSLSASLQRFGLDKAPPRVKSLEELLAEDEEPEANGHEPEAQQ